MVHIHMMFPIECTQNARSVYRHSENHENQYGAANMNQYWAYARRSKNYSMVASENGFDADDRQEEEETAEISSGTPRTPPAIEYPLISFANWTRPFLRLLKFPRNGRIRLLSKLNKPSKL